MPYPVKLHAYDVSYGKMRTISVAFFGKYIDGLYHTAIVVHGQEYFYGGQGIAYVEPCGTSLGHPTEIMDLGQTEIDEENFIKYLEDVADTKFTPEAYRVAEFNCNTFSTDVAKFLTGKVLPDKITCLNSDLLNSPFGQMMGTSLKNMKGPQHNGHFIKRRSKVTPEAVVDEAKDKTETTVPV